MNKKVSDETLTTILVETENLLFEEFSRTDDVRYMWHMYIMK